MNYREKEYKKLGIDARWLDKEHAKHANDYAEIVFVGVFVCLNQVVITSKGFDDVRF